MESLIDFFKNNWLATAFLAPMFWALVNIIDVYFVGGVYKDEADGTIISGVFQIVPWLLIFFLAPFSPADAADLVFSQNGAWLFSFFGGILFSASMYFYFKALFNKNDVSLMQIFWNLTVAAVPVLSFLLLGEVLPPLKYAGLAVVLSGATALSFNSKLRQNFSRGYFKIILGAVLFLSLSMILQEKSYNLLLEIYGGRGFWLGFFFFSLGAAAAGLAFSLFFRRNPLPIVKKYYKIFLLGESIYFLGNLFSQKALDIAPSVSYVAVVETFVPVFILAYSLLILFIFSSILRRKNRAVGKIYSEQVSGIWAKVSATIIMAAGVWLIA